MKTFGFSSELATLLASCVLGAGVVGGPGTFEAAFMGAFLLMVFIAACAIFIWVWDRAPGWVQFQGIPIVVGLTATAMMSLSPKIAFITLGVAACYLIAMVLVNHATRDRLVLAVSCVVIFPAPLLVWWLA